MFEIEIINDREKEKEKEMVDASADRCFIDENKTLWFPIFVPTAIRPGVKGLTGKIGQWRWGHLIKDGCELHHKTGLDVSKMEEVRLSVQVTIGRHFDKKRE